MIREFPIEIIVGLAMAGILLTGCNKSSSPATTSSYPNDPVEKKLLDLAGSGAINCGHLKSQVPEQLDAAGKCVLQAAQQKRPFYVAYEMPGMTVAVAGDSDGKLFSLQTQPSAPTGLAAVPCPAELRVAPSGRVTCYAPGTFPMLGGMDSHSGMPATPAMGQNPPEDHITLPAGHPKINPKPSQTPPPK